MTSLKDGGSAFPQVETDYANAGNHPGDELPYSHTYSYGVMSLRDYFAGQVLFRMARDYDRGDESEGADRCYEWADAMLKAREVTHGH